MLSKATIAIVGAGPSGFYAAEALLEALPGCQIHLLEKTLAPHGLVRYGVAPDHQKLKQVASVFDDIVNNERVSLHAGVEVGVDVTLDEIRSHCDAVVLATGSALGRQVGVGGETLQQVFTSASFVGWYNGHPNAMALAPDLNVASAVLIGNGNVSLDVCRLLVRPMEDLAVSDIPEPMLDVFRTRRVKVVHVIGRGGPADVKFTFKEFRQLADLSNVHICFPQFDTVSEDEASRAKSPEASRFLKWLRTAYQPISSPTEKEHTVVNFWFNLMPVEFVGSEKVSAVTVQSTASNEDRSHIELLTLPCELAVTCVGFSCQPLAGVPDYSKAGFVNHVAGQVVDAQGSDVPGLFVAGWAKRGPTGVIGTNRADAQETVETLLKKMTSPTNFANEPLELLGDFFADKGIRTITSADWRIVDRLEKIHGGCRGKPREKFLSFDAAWKAIA